MNAALLLKHYARIADAPDAIGRLRRFVLDLAVRGNLVEQDAEDEPASELLRHIRAKALKGRKASLRNSMAETPYSLPPTWEWVPVSVAFEYDAGRKVDPKDLRSDAWLLELEDIEKDTGRLVARVPVSERSPLSTKSEFIAGDILYGKLRPYLNKVIVAGEAGYSTTEIVALRPLVPAFPPYCALALRRPDFVEYVSRLGQGTKMPRLRTEDALIAPFPLPPLPEQHRIVAKVDELMALCDQLEAARAEREAARDAFTLATFAQLNTPDPETFSQDARFALANLTPLTTRTDQIKRLRQTILNLAVRGKLVAQNAGDEPASALLDRISTENQKIALEKGIRAQKPGLPIDSINDAVKLPSTWQYAYLQDIAYQITDGTHLTPKYTEAGRPFLSAQNVKPFRFMPEKHRFVSEADFDSYRANRRPERGDILMTRVGAGIGEAAILNSDFEFAFYVSLCLIKVPNHLVSV